MKRSVTIKDVARETKLAVSTISKYMNGGNIREENRALIEKVIQRLGYQPNNAARGLRSAKTYTVGLLLDYTGSQFSSKMAAHIEYELRKRGYSLILTGHLDDPEKAEEAARFLVNEQVDGCIVVTLAGGEQFLKPFKEAGIPLLLLDRVIAGEEANYDSVMANGASGIYDVIEYLIRKGHKKIAMITGLDRDNTGIVAARDRLRGYERAFEDYAIEINKNYIMGGDFSYQSGYTEMHRLWRQDEKPTALCTANYDMGLGAMVAINELNIKIPEELSFVMFDDFEFSCLNRPRITAVRQPIEEIAEQAAVILTRRMNGDWTGYPQQLRIHTDMQIRESVKDLNIME